MQQLKKHVKNFYLLPKSNRKTLTAFMLGGNSELKSYLGMKISRDLMIVWI